MTFNYAQAQADADTLIQEFGMEAALRRANVDRPCLVVVVEYDPHEKPADLTTPTDRRVIMSALDEIAPDNEQDQLVTFVQPMTSPPVINEILPMTCKPKPTAPGGVVVLWEFTVRR